MLYIMEEDDISVVPGSRLSVAQMLMYNQRCGAFLQMKACRMQDTH